MLILRVARKFCRKDHLTCRLNSPIDSIASNSIPAPDSDAQRAGKVIDADPVRHLHPAAGHERRTEGNTVKP